MDVKDLRANSKLLEKGLRLYSAAWSEEDAFQQAFLYLENDKDHDPDRVGKLMCVTAARRIRESFSTIPISEDIPISDFIDIDISKLFRKMNGLQVVVCKLLLEGKSIQDIVSYLGISIDKCYRTINALRVLDIGTIE